MTLPSSQAIFGQVHTPRMSSSFHSLKGAEGSSTKSSKSSKSAMAVCIVPGDLAEFYSRYAQLSVNILYLRFPHWIGFPHSSSLCLFWLQQFLKCSSEVHTAACCRIDAWQRTVASVHCIEHMLKGIFPN